MASVAESPPPHTISPIAQDLLDEAVSIGLRPLGWLTVTMSSIMPLAAFVDDDGASTFVVIGMYGPQGFTPSVTEFVSHLDGPRKVTTTSNPLAIGQSTRGIYKFSYPGMALPDLYDAHLGHVAELDATIEQFMNTLPEVAQSIVDYLAFEAGH